MGGEKHLLRNIVVIISSIFLLVPSWYELPSPDVVEALKSCIFGVKSLGSRGKKNHFCPCVRVKTHLKVIYQLLSCLCCARENCRCCQSRQLDPKHTVVVSSCAVFNTDSVFHTDATLKDGVKVEDFPPPLPASGRRAAFLQHVPVSAIKASVTASSPSTRSILQHLLKHGVSFFPFSSTNSEACSPFLNICARLPFLL